MESVHYIRNVLMVEAPVKAYFATASTRNKKVYNIGTSTEWFSFLSSRFLSTSLAE